MDPKEMLLDMRIGRITSYAEVPRWAGFPTFIKNLAWKLGLDCTVEVDKGILRETVRFKVEGYGYKLEKFAKILQDSMDEYNSR